MDIGIYGGTFDPPHIGHVHAARTASRVLRLDRLMIIPTCEPPHKALPGDAPDGYHRLEMARLAFGTLPRVEVSDMELRRGGTSYTVDTLRAVKERYPNDTLWLLMGSDMAENFPTWRSPQEILSMAKIAVFSRDDTAIQEVMQGTAYRELVRQIIWIPLEPHIVSSTEIRSGLAQGEKRELVPETVLGYIEREGLYGVQVDLKNIAPDALRPIALSYLKSSRAPHVLGTEKEAVRLARRYGADETQARVAALLHDCTKKLSVSEHLQLCEKYGLRIEDIEHSAPQLLHAKTGAALARDVFDVCDAVYNAILWHTTGKADMTVLEKVIYLADCIEPTRVYPGVDELRKTAYEDLDAAVAMSLRATVERMEKTGEPLHAKTREALRFLDGMS